MFKSSKFLCSSLWEYISNLPHTVYIWRYSSMLFIYPLSSADPPTKVTTLVSCFIALNICIFMDCLLPDISSGS